MDLIISNALGDSKSSAFFPSPDQVALATAYKRPRPTQVHHRSQITTNQLQAKLQASASATALAFNRALTAHDIHSTQKHDVSDLLPKRLPAATDITSYEKPTHDRLLEAVKKNVQDVVENNLARENAGLPKVLQELTAHLRDYELLSDQLEVADNSFIAFLRQLYVNYDAPFVGMF